MRKIYKNIAEEQFCRFIEEKGFIPIKRGWPDFFCKNKNGEIILVEVKPAPWDRLKPEQFLVMEALVKYGVPCYRWDARARKLEKIEPQIMAKKTQRT